MTKYKIGDIVVSKIDLWGSDNPRMYAPKGTKFRIVAISPKVVKIKYPDGIYWDGKAYFANLVIIEQASNYGNRFRNDFCTFEKENKK